MAYKPPAALAVFDPGAAPYLGQVIWLEAHRQDPAMFRPAEDAPELGRLADLSVAGVLTNLLPLLVFVMGYGAFAGERERGTLRQVMTAGAGQDAVFAGKLVAVAGVGVAVAFVVDRHLDGGGSDLQRRRQRTRHDRERREHIRRLRRVRVRMRRSRAASCLLSREPRRRHC